jgi:Domain of unknown function (DUF4387)
MSDYSFISDDFRLIRSKDAGPFMLTIDLFFADSATRERYLASGLFDAAAIGELYGVDAAEVTRYDLADIDAVKISFPRPVASGEWGDTDITGGQQYSLLVDAIAANGRPSGLRRPSVDSAVQSPRILHRGKLSQ